MSANILEKVGTVVIPATKEPFVAKDRFMLNADPEAGVLINYLSANFNLWFGDKTEEPVCEQTLCYHKFLQFSVDGSIIAELGGEAKAEVTLSELRFLMECQKHGEDGVLLNNGWSNIFYIKDKSGVLRAVYVRWGGDGWGVGAYSVEGPDGWRDGRQVFSRNSVL